MLVSILIPCFNAEEWIARAIESALAQTWPDKEIIVVDDGSYDGSLEIIRRFDGRIHWDTGPNRGGNAARNRLLERAKGEWLQYLDADDYLLPEKIRRQAEFASAHPEADVIYSPTLCEKIEGDRPTLVDEPIPEPRDDPWVLLALWHLPQTGGPLWKRAALMSVNGWRIGQPCCQEHELYFRLLAAGSRFVFFDDRSAVYRNWDIGGRLTGKHVNEVPKQRLIILDQIETFLHEAGLLTDTRRQAVNDARHQLARRMWHYDRKLAMEMADRIYRSDASFRPSGGVASPRVYRLVYRLLGFQGAQQVGDFGRRLTHVI
jgi:glycosyltransferase involved in cell wall biosynthesis